MKRIISKLIILSLFIFINFSVPTMAQSPMTVHFLDVGKADCILIQTPSGHHMLIDAGRKKHAEFIEAYLDKLHIKKLDVVVGTHPHKDHIGALDNIIEDYDVGQVYLPHIAADTGAYQDLRDIIQSKGLKIRKAMAGVEIKLDPALKVIVLAPSREGYADINDYSAVIKLTYRHKSFLFTGDATKLSETEMLSRGVLTLKADVLKVGGHGDHSSTSRKFLKAVKPQYAVISTGTDERLDRKTLKRLNDCRRIYRTDIDGTVVMRTDGATIHITTEKQR